MIGRPFDRLRVWHVLAMAFVLRVAVGLSTDSVLQPDEAVQYLEQAHRLVFGAGIIPWEYNYGVRSWVPALFIAAVLEALRRVGLDSPRVYQPAVVVVLSAASLSIPYSAYRIARTLFSETAAWRALFFTAFWYELVAYGHRSTADALAAYPAFGALALALGEPRRRATVSCGVLAGVTVVLRYQLVPAVAAIGVIALWRWRWSGWPAALAALLVVLAGGALDAYTWGVWFASIVLSVEFNLAQSVRFGAQPFYWYAITLVVLSGGLCLVGAAGLLRSWKQSWPLLAVGAVTAAAFSAATHKEPRFVLLLTPLWLIGLAALSAGWTRTTGAALMAGFIAASGLGLSHRLPYQHRYMRPPLARVPTREAYRALAAEHDVVAVLDASARDRDSPWYLPPYYDLHHDVPLYFPLSTGFATVRQDPARYASHAITIAAQGPPPGFRALKRVGRLVISRREVDPPATAVPDGYDREIAALQPIREPPRVLPRW